jgi:glutaredoxin
MAQMEVVLYTRRGSLRCWRAKRLLAHRGYVVKVGFTTNDKLRDLLEQFTQVTSHKKTMPYVLIAHRPVGDLGDIKALDYLGVLELLVRCEV